MSAISSTNRIQIGQIFRICVLRARRFRLRDATPRDDRRCRRRADGAIRPCYRPHHEAPRSSTVRTSTSRSMPRARNFFAVTGPTPHSASTGSCCRNGSTRSGGITVRPSGFFHPDAIFARNLFGATPADAVRPVVAANALLQALRHSRRQRLVPTVLGDVEIRFVERQRLDERRHFPIDLEDDVRGCLVAREVRRNDDERRAQSNGFGHRHR